MNAGRVLAVLLAISISSTASAGGLQLAITPRAGSRVVVTDADFDNKHLKFKFRVGKEKRELPLSDVARVEFAPFDSLSVAPPSGVRDVFTMKCGHNLATDRPHLAELHGLQAERAEMALNDVEFGQPVDHLYGPGKSK